MVMELKKEIGEAKKAVENDKFQIKKNVTKIQYSQVPSRIVFIENWYVLILLPNNL